MKYLLTVVVTFFIMSFGFSQEDKSHFIELNISSGFLKKKNFLINELSTDVIHGYLDDNIYDKSPTGNSYGIHFKYGKYLGRKWAFVSQIGYKNWIEPVNCDCFICDKAITSADKKFSALDMSIGWRYSIFEINSFTSAIEINTAWSNAFQYKNLDYFSMNIFPMLGYSFSEEWTSFFKYGWDMTLGKHKKQEHLLQLGMQYNF